MFKKISFLISVIGLFVFLPITVKAETIIFERTESFTGLTSNVRTGIDVHEDSYGTETSPKSVIGHFEDISSYDLGITLDNQKYYHIIIQWNAIELNRYGIQPGYSSLTSEMFLSYGGKKFYWDGSYLSIIVQGNGYQTIGLGADMTLTVSSYLDTYYNSYFYNEVYGEVKASPYIRIWEMTKQEVASYNGDDLIIDNLGNVVEEVQESNNWLEKIFNYLNESQEQQKQEAQTQGSNSTSQGMDAIEDKGGDFAGSLSGLTNSMSYTGTECAWNFPEVKLPAISGVMDEIVLIESQPIDFTQWVNAIPDAILILVQSLLTIGLIVFCFKELYSTIAYVLTLRKDDNA